ncbi:MAG: hypothetical protein U0531_12480 [Dehalococcoidia bacterium]
MREVCRTHLDTSFEMLEYVQLNPLVKAIQKEAQPMLGRRTADAIADDILLLRDQADDGMPGRVIGNVGRVMGAAAEPFMRNVCSKLGVPFDGVDRSTLTLVAESAEADATPLLGPDTAQAVRHAVERASKPAGMAGKIAEAARQHAGERGETFLRNLCHTRLEMDLEEIEPEGLRPLADAIRAEGADIIGVDGATAFAQAVVAAVLSPNEALHKKITETARRYIGPAGDDFLRKSCKKQGMPWDAVEMEHMMWLAEVVRAESAPLIGKKPADEFARTVRGFLVGGK